VAELKLSCWATTMLGSVLANTQSIATYRQTSLLPRRRRHHPHRRHHCIFQARERRLQSRSTAHRFFMAERTCVVAMVTWTLLPQSGARYSGVTEAWRIAMLSRRRNRASNGRKLMGSVPTGNRCQRAGTSTGRRMWRNTSRSRSDWQWAWL